MDSRRRMQLYRTMHLWHWISAAVCFAALTLFTDLYGQDANFRDVAAKVRELRASLG